MPEVTIIVFGRADCEDDGVGPFVLDELRREHVRARLAHLRPDPSDLAAAFEGCDAAILIDAAQSGAPPGTLHLFDLTTQTLPASLRAQHGLSLADTIRLVAAIWGLPPICHLVAIEAEGVRQGHKMTPAVAAAATAVAQDLAAWIDPSDRLQPVPTFHAPAL